MKLNNHRMVLVLALGCALAWPGRGYGAEKKAADFLKGPAKAQMKDIAEVQVPEGYMFTGAKGTQDLLKRMGNPINGSELGFLAPTSMAWFVVFEFNPCGYVKDDDKNKLDADKMLKSIQRGNEAANEERKKMGSPALHVTGWEQPPKYNEETHNLEWAIRGECQGEPVVNFNTRLLGRKGVMEVSLVVDPTNMVATLPVYQDLLKDYRFSTGQQYAEYRQGDKLAKYGLAALITGAGVAVAAKTGLLTALLLFLKKGWKLVVVAVVGVLAFFKRLIVGRTASTKDSLE